MANLTWLTETKFEINQLSLTLCDARLNFFSYALTVLVLYLIPPPTNELAKYISG